MTRPWSFQRERSGAHHGRFFAPGVGVWEGGYEFLPHHNTERNITSQGFAACGVALFSITSQAAEGFCPPALGLKRRRFRSLFFVGCHLGLGDDLLLHVK